jgi:hypothetical protein
MKFFFFRIKMSARQKGAVRSLKLEMVWNRYDELIWGSQVIEQTVVQEWVARFPGLERVEVQVEYHDGRARTGRARTESARVELVGKLGAAMGRLKHWVEEDRPGITCVVRAVGAAPSKE